MLSLAAVVICASGWLENVIVDSGEARFPPPTQAMMRRYLDHATEKHLAARLERVEALVTPVDVAALAAEKRAALLAALGGLPERTPLNPQVMGQGAGEGYRYEKVIFESQPGFFVTGVLYLPADTAKRVPGVIVPCGHSANGKAMESYQRASILLAKNGIAAFCYDPIGQGERYFFLSEDGTPELGATVEHTVIGASAILTGSSTAAIRIWDGMRALDYLASRPEVDAEKLGCTGNSGGGTLTSYLMALDERVQCAAVSCYLTSFERLLATIGPQDAEQNHFAQLANGIDHADYLLMRAPKPTLICAATKDFFDIRGTWDTFREAKRVYTKAGFSERVDLIENLDEHGFHKPQREAMVRWMRRWLAGVDAPITEPEFPVHTEAELQCSPQGQVKLLPGARSVFDLLGEREAKLAAARAAIATPEELRAAVAKKAGYVPSNSDVPCYQRSDADPAGRLTLRIYPEIPGPALENPQGIAPRPHDIVLEASVVLPPDAVNEIRLCLRPEGRAAVDTEGTAEPGVAKVFLDLRGTGATKPDDESHGWDASVGAEWPSYFRAYLIGKSYTGMWVMDIAMTARAVRHALGMGAPVALEAKGFTTIPALHAAALEPALIAKTTLDGGIPSWRAVIAEPRARHQLFTAVHGALETYDLDQLPALAAPESVTVLNAAVPTF